MSVTRREFAAITAQALGAVALGTACSARAPQQDGRLAARPKSGVMTAAKSGRLGLAGNRDATLRLPSSAAAGPLPLFVLLHGAGGSGDGIVRRLGEFADKEGLAVLAPDARADTWDAVRGEFGDDVAFIDRALARVFESAAVDPARVTIGGFSDGASYAISLGLINGDLFSRIVAFSPGFYVGGRVHGRPRIFVTHGSDDRILPINRCSKVIVPALEKAGYDVTFRQFDGGHEVPPNLAVAGMRFAKG